MPKKEPKNLPPAEQFLKKAQIKNIYGSLWHLDIITLAERHRNFIVYKLGKKNQNLFQRCFYGQSQNKTINSPEQAVQENIGFTK
jgi:hypothetical protein